MMKWLLAPNAFKGTLSATQVADLIAGCLPSGIQATKMPVADGGDGTSSLLAKVMNLQELPAHGLNAIGKVSKGMIYLNHQEDTAYIDISDLSGVAGLPDFQVNASWTSSYGTGLQIQKAISRGVSKVVLGLGGSATVDLGTGILRALGYLFLDKKGREIPVYSPGFLQKVAFIQRPIKKYKLQFTCLCDVNSIFFGSKGAIPVFGPQKGLHGEALRDHEIAAERVFNLLKQKSPTLYDRQGFGAAGGIALGLSAFFPTTIEMGSDYFFKQTQMDTLFSRRIWC